MLVQFVDFVVDSTNGLVFCFGGSIFPALVNEAVSILPFCGIPEFLLPGCQCVVVMLSCDVFVAVSLLQL